MHEVYPDIIPFSTDISSIQTLSLGMRTSIIYEDIAGRRYTWVFKSLEHEISSPCPSKMVIGRHFL